MTILTDIWRLRTDPFYPEVDEHGHKIEKKALKRSLNPLIDHRVVPLYFDVYDWSYSPLIGGLSPKDALERFPGPQSLLSDSPLLILISGTGQTGLDSMANLILHKIKLSTEEDEEPLVCEVVLEDRDKVRNVEAAARAFIEAVEFADPEIDDAPALVKRLRAKLDEEMKANEGRDTSYTQVFTAFSKILRGVSREYIIWIKKGGDHDSWGRIQDAVGQLCAHVIVTTGDMVFAKTCYDQVVALKKNVAWISTGPLDEAKALQFVENRLAAHRIKDPAAQPPDRFSPFTEKSIRTLYKPGSAGTDPELGAPRHSIGWLRRTLHKALEDHLAWLEQEPGAAGDPDAIRIDEKRLRATSEALNQPGAKS
jgi:hypothetical protein